MFPVFIAQDIQGEVPTHLLRLKVEVEQNQVAVIIEECRAELDREMQSLSATCTSERVIKEHRVSLLETFTQETSSESIMKVKPLY